MSNIIHTPGLVKVDDHSDTSASFVIEPLHNGYGMTLGNSMRRVLLSSISGAAVTAFKIEGVTHEFTSVPGVKEDIVDIMLNLKGVRLRVYGNEVQTLRIAKQGKGAVTAKDIQTNADVEIVNPEHVIATIDEAKSKLVLDLTVEVGRGYRTIEEGAARKASDMIAIDAIFSPVLPRTLSRKPRPSWSTSTPRWPVRLGSPSAKRQPKTAPARKTNSATTCWAKKRQPSAPL